MNTPEADDGSVLDTIRSIQEGNPQIETIFLDSDEDQPEQPDNSEIASDLGYVQPWPSPPKTQPPAPQVPLLPTTPTKKIEPFSPPPPPPASIPKPEADVKRNKPLTISHQYRPQIFPVNTSPNAKKKYLFIPNDLLPVLANSKGPVSLQVPGIGAVVIPKPHELIPVGPAPKPLVKREEEKKPPEPPKYDPLCDHKYHCWRYRRMIKRDLDGFSFSDRLGFYKAEQHRGSMCSKRTWDIVKKLEVSSSIIEKKLAAIQEKKGMSKLQEQHRRHQSKTFVKLKRQQKALSPMQKKNLKTLMSWKQHFRQSSETETGSEGPDDDDLLVTKKVVILNEKRKQGRPRKKKTGRPRKIKEEVSNVLMKEPGRPRKIKQEVIEVLKKKRGRPRKDNGKKKIGRQRKHRNKEAVSKMKVKEELPQIKPCFVGLTRLQISKDSIKLYKEYYEPDSGHKIINNLKEFQADIDPAKPLLVINEDQCSKLNFTKICSTNNIIYPIEEKKTIPATLITLAKVCKIKFVLPEILFKYMSGVRDPC